MQFIINTLTQWEEPPRARHQVTFALAKKYKVAYVSANKIGFPKVNIIDQNENIVLIQPYFLFSFRIRYRIPIFNELYQLWIFSWLKKKYGDVEMINFDFTAYLIHKYFKRVYYYCNDNFSVISRKINVWPIYLYHSCCERILARHARLCIGTSPIIVAGLLKMNSKSYEIPLGGPDIEEFDLKPSEKNETGSAINIGLVGFISNYNLSVQLINNILSMVDCTISLIGPVEHEFYDKITEKNRVILKGVLRDKELLSEVNKFDVAIAPYLDRKISEGGVPNKLLIYLALGKPVVVTELLSLKQMDLQYKLVYLVNTIDEFPQLIKRAHHENSWDLIQQRVSYAKENTWEIRIEKFISLLKLNS